MAVRTEDHRRVYITVLGHQLMADTVVSVYMDHAIFFCKGITVWNIVSSSWLAGTKVVVNQHHLVRIQSF